ncbi:MAG: Uma2 family endonuclease [Acidimicrobiales bacterium]
MSLVTGLSAEEFLARDDWPRGSQLIAGEVIVNQPALPHQLVVGRLYARLLAWTDAAPGRGLVALPVDVRLGPADVYAPDLWWLREARRPPPGARQLDGLPDLVAEVRSPSTWRYDTGTKRRRYEAEGVAELWLVDTDNRKVLVHRRSSPESLTLDVTLEVAHTDVLTSPLLPGFAIPVGDFISG